jgi:hypothetical protein
MGQSIRQDMVKRLRLSRDAESPEVLEFWRQHGAEWAREEASFAEIRRLVDISKAAAARSAGDAATYALAELKAIWRAGWPGSVEPYGWDEMNDMLPSLAYLAFLQGVEAAWNEVSEQL